MLRWKLRWFVARITTFLRNKFYVAKRRRNIVAPQVARKMLPILLGLYGGLLSPSLKHTVLPIYGIH